MVEAVVEVKEEVEVEEEAEDEEQQLQQHQQSQRDINMILARSRMKNRYWNWENKSLLTREKRRTHLRTPENLSWSQTNLGIPNHIKGRVHKIFWFPELFPPWKRFFNGWEYQRRPDLP